MLSLSNKLEVQNKLASGQRSCQIPAVDLSRLRVDLRNQKSKTTGQNSCQYEDSHVSISQLFIYADLQLIQKPEVHNKLVRAHIQFQAFVYHIYCISFFYRFLMQFSSQVHLHHISYCRVSQFLLHIQGLNSLEVLICKSNQIVREL